MGDVKDEPSFGLNIVVAPSSQADRAPKTKPKKRNKYEKRRAKARQAKQRQRGVKPEKTKPGLSSPSGAPSSTQVESTDKPSNQESDSTTTHQVATQEPLPSPATQSDGKVEPTISVDQQERDNSNDQEDMVQDVKKSSRKTNHRSRMITLEDEKERARYMAEFHARPLEMDRKSGATSRIVPSQSSQHLFEKSPSDGVDDDDDDDKTIVFHGKLHRRIASTLQTKFHLTQPTHIQRQVLNVFAPQQSNLFVQSETGSGKTLAYLLPIVQALAVDQDKVGELRRLDRTKGGTRCVILCPTRELASQTAAVVETLCCPWLVGGSLSGGEKRKSEKQRLRKGIHVLVATPGRLLDHLQKTESLLVSLKGKLEYLVLDEADRLLQDQGLCGQVQQIVQHIRANQPGSGPKKDGVTWTSLLVSATVPPQVEKTARATLLGMDRWVWARGTTATTKSKKANDAATTKTDANLQEDTANQLQQQQPLLEESTPRQLRQLHMTVTAKLRLTSLIAFLAQCVSKKERVVVFLSTCDGVDYFHALMEAMDCIFPQDEEQPEHNNLFACPIYKLHGNVPHRERQRILQRLHSGRHNQQKKSKQAVVLLATDVAARGLNLTVDWTVQYDPPCEVADYAHRAGRTARAGQAGHSLLFLLPSEQPFIEVLRLHGMSDLTPLSLATTLNTAARLCPDLSNNNNNNNNPGTKDKSASAKSTTLANSRKRGGSREGESFCLDLQKKLEELLLQQDAAARANRYQSSGKKGKKNNNNNNKSENSKTGELISMARQAYVSFLRSYPTKEKRVRHIFSARGLHLGHTARSFALQEPPTTLVHRMSSAKSDRKKKGKMKKNGNANNNDDNSNNNNKRLAFQAVLDKDKETAMPESKRQRLTKRPDGTTDVIKARAMLLERAKKLQTGGMDAF